MLPDDSVRLDGVRAAAERDRVLALAAAHLALVHVDRWRCPLSARAVAPLVTVVGELRLAALRRRVNDRLARSEPTKRSHRGDPAAHSAARRGAPMHAAIALDLLGR